VSGKWRRLGAPADLINSVTRALVNLLVGEGFINRARPAFSNQLVVASSVEPKQNIDFTRRETFKAALADGYLAVGHVGSVPAGLYAHQTLTYFDLWSDLAPQILRVDHIRAALRLAQVNEAWLAIVYASDLVAQTTVHKVASVPEEAHEPIIYTIGLLSQNSTQAADTFADFLTSKPALEVFYHFGFTPLR
jgi:molybdate transport system substrate-binding protein